MSPKVGLKPNTPQKAAGRMTEPPVCVPTAAGTMPAATAAAEPEEEPPGVCSRFTGLRVRDGVRVASSVVTVLPRMTAPARRSAVTQEASSEGRRPLKMALPCSVGMSAVSMTSLRPTGTPCNGPTPLPARRSASAVRACSSAHSRSRKAQAWTWGSSASMRARQAWTRASEEMSPLARRAAASATVRAVRSASAKTVGSLGLRPNARRQRRPPFSP